MTKYNMNQQQWMVFLAYALSFLGGAVVSRGWLTEVQASNLINQILNAIPTITNGIAVLVPIVAAVWGIIKQSHASVVTSAANLPGVQKILVDSRTASEGVLTVAKDVTIPKVEVVK
jgi:hypothetical protein